MKLGQICGSVVATVKDPALSGYGLRLLRPASGEESWSDRPIVAVDTIGVRDGDTVIWISAREATLALTDHILPTDAAIVGIVDQM